MANLSTVYILCILLASGFGMGSAFLGNKIFPLKGGSEIDVPPYTLEGEWLATQLGKEFKNQELGVILSKFIKTSVENWSSIVGSVSELSKMFRKMGKCETKLNGICKIVKDKYDNMIKYIEDREYQDKGDQSREVIVMLLALQPPPSEVKPVEQSVEIAQPEPEPEPEPEPSPELEQKIAERFGNPEAAKHISDFIRTPVAEWKNIANSLSELKKKYLKARVDQDHNNCPVELLNLCTMVSHKFSNMKDFINNEPYETIGDETQEALKILETNPAPEVSTTTTTTEAPVPEPAPELQEQLQGVEPAHEPLPLTGVETGGKLRRRTVKKRKV